MTDSLEDAYEAGLAHEKAGRLDEAAAAYRKALALDPADPGGVAVRLAAIGRGAAPDKAPTAYVAALFDQHAEVFDSILVDQLGYAVPMTMRERLQAQGLGPFKSVLDLGCGTGLAALALEDMADRFTGVDLAERMIEVAADDDLYDELFVGDVVRFMEETDERWDLIAATDLLPYIGAADPLIRGAAERLDTGGVFVFSTETMSAEEMAGADWRVTPYHRFAHSPAYLKRELGHAGLEVVEIFDISVREEQGVPLPGHLITARKP